MEAISRNDDETVNGTLRLYQGRVKEAGSFFMQPAPGVSMTG